MENLIDQFDTLELGLVMDGSHCVMRIHVALDEKASLLAIARSLQPIESYEGLLPETDRFMAAAWVRADRTKATAELKAFLMPVMDFKFLEKLGEVAEQAGGAVKSADGTSPMEALRKSIDEQWKLLDQYPDAIGNRSAVLFGKSPTPARGSSGRPASRS